MNNLRLLNKHEELTFEKLQESISNEAKVFSKVRLADVFPIIGSGINDQLYSYSLKAHFDFLIVDNNFYPLFAVEFDGKQHKSNIKQIENDSFKNTLCEKFQLPLLRINSKYIDRKYKGIDLLTYFVDVWFLETAFYEAQQKGIIPLDEPFDACMFINNGKNQKWPYWISSEIQLKMQQFYKDKRIKQPAPSFWVGTDKKGNYKCICWLEIDDQNIIHVKTGMQKQLFSAVYISDLISMLSFFDIDKELEHFFQGNSQTESHETFQTTLSKFCNELELRLSSTCGRIKI